jgi:hypothetical protein
MRENKTWMSRLQVMKTIDHWSENGDIEVAESAGGVLATVNPFDNLVCTAPGPIYDVLNCAVTDTIVKVENRSRS